MMDNRDLSYDVGGSPAPFSLKGRRGLLVARGVLLFGNSNSGAHNIRGPTAPDSYSRSVFHAAGGPDQPLVRVQKRARVGSFLASLFAVGAGRKISITPIYYPSVCGRATKSCAYAARAHNAGPFTSGPMRTESAVSLKINLSVAQIIACTP